MPLFSFLHLLLLLKEEAFEGKEESQIFTKTNYFL